MRQLFEHILQAVEAERFIVSSDAYDRRCERMIELGQLSSELYDARLLSERSQDTPNPSIEVKQTLADGTPVKVAWAWIDSHRLAVLVTVHFYNG